MIHMKKTLQSLLSCAMALFLLCGVALSPAPARGEALPAQEPVTLEDCPVMRNEEFGHVNLDISINDFNALGFTYGCSVRMVFSNGYVMENIPYYNGYYTLTGDPLLVSYPGYAHVMAGINNGDSLWAVAGLEEGMTVTVTMQDRDAYVTIQKSRDLVYSDNPADYPSPEVFANFRSISTRNIRPDWVYRSASPGDNKRGRAAITDDLTEAAGIRYILDLADTEEKIQGYLKAEGFDSPYLKGLLEQGNVYPAGLNTAFRIRATKTALGEMLKEMPRHEGPYLIHCTEGKDRTGFVCMLLEALAGASWDEMEQDYMLTYENYYGITREGDPERYHVIVGMVFTSLVQTMFGNIIPMNYHTADLSAGARNYLHSCGLTEEEIDALTAAICEP